MDAIKAAYKDFLADPKKINNLTAIRTLVFPKEGVAELAVFEKGITAILGIFKKCIQGRLLLFGGKVDSGALGRVQEWLRAFFLSFLDDLLSGLKEADEKRRQLSFEAVLALMELQHESDCSTYNFPMDVYSRLVRACLADASLMGMLQDALLQYSDLRFYAFRIIAKLAKEDSPFVLANGQLIVDLLTPLPHRFDTDASKKAAAKDVDSAEEETEEGKNDGSDIEYSSSDEESQDEEETGDADEEGEVDMDLFYLPIREGASLPAVATDRGHRHEFTQCWLALLEVRFDKDVVRAVLSVLDDRVIPGLTTPTLLADFLSRAYDQFGWAALAALWSLMLSHGLDYPDFYPKLYALLQPAFLNSPVEFGAKQAKLLSAFLTRSTHLPAYYAAAFVKRLAELAVYAPPSTAMNIHIPLIYNILRKHPECQEKMLASEGTSVTLYDTSVISKGGDVPLFELLTLCRHWYGPLAYQVRTLFLGVRQLNRHIDITPPAEIDAGRGKKRHADPYDDLLQKELAHRWSKVPPTQSVISESLF